jgi:4-hydroxyphenylpyruvate dioxygenase
LGTDHIEFYVGNAKQAAHYYITAFGFQPLAYEGPETGTREKASYAVRQNKLTFVLTTPLKTSTPISEHVNKHGDGVKVLALSVDDARKAWEETTSRGARSYIEPVVLTGDEGEVVLSGIRLYGDTVHTFVERKITKAFFYLDIKNGNCHISKQAKRVCYMLIIVSEMSAGTK